MFTEFAVSTLTILCDKCMKKPAIISGQKSREKSREKRQKKYKRKQIPKTKMIGLKMILQ